MGLYEHNNRRHVRYYYAATGEYKDHGRMIYKEIPQKGDLICPLLEHWEVVEVKFPDDDICMEIYFNETEIKT